MALNEFNFTIIKIIVILFAKSYGLYTHKTV